LFEGGVENGVLGGSVRVAWSDVKLETNHRDGIRKIKGDFLCCAQFGYKHSLETAGKTVGLFYQRFVMGVINVACTGLELSILPDLGADRLLYLVTCAKGGKGRMELTKGILKSRAAFHYITDCYVRVKIILSDFLKFPLLFS
jgi:hypothetical protein